MAETLHHNDLHLYDRVWLSLFEGYLLHPTHTYVHRWLCNAFMLCFCTFQYICLRLRRVHAFWHLNKEQAGFVSYLRVKACLRCHLSHFASPFSEAGGTLCICGPWSCRRFLQPSLVSQTGCMCVCALLEHVSRSQVNMDCIRSFRDLINLTALLGIFIGGVGWSIRLSWFSKYNQRLDLNSDISKKTREELQLSCWRRLN